ncbi:MAG: aldo/keto reductase [Pseudorhodoplanes sp.]
MDYIHLGKSSLKVSRIALGCMGIGSAKWRSWVVGEDEGRKIITRAIEQGINTFDSCDFYSGGESERILGKVLKETSRREDVVIATKVGFAILPGPNGRGYSRKHIIEACEGSLKRLGVEYIDLYQTHIWDPATNLEEMVEAFDHLVRAGKVLYVGATDLPCWTLSRAVYIARLRGLTSFSTLQHHYNAVWREDERDALPFCEAEGMGVLPYSPMARGFLTGRKGHAEKSTERFRTDDLIDKWYGRPEDAKVLDAIEAIAKEMSVTPGAVALQWVLAKLPKSCPVVGVTRTDEVNDAIKALEKPLGADAVARIDAAYGLRPYVPHG